MVRPSSRFAACRASRAAGFVWFVYNARMDVARATQQNSEHDESLVDWFLTLSPAERLAELESRVAFFNQVRRSGDRKLPQNPGDL
jgi:hypothetical protein